jgi:hypothetical protein
MELSYEAELDLTQKQNESVREFLSQWESRFQDLGNQYPLPKESFDLNQVSDSRAVYCVYTDMLSEINEPSPQEIAEQKKAKQKQKEQSIANTGRTVYFSDNSRFLKRSFFDLFTLRTLMKIEQCLNEEDNFVSIVSGLASLLETEFKTRFFDHLDPAVFEDILAILIKHDKLSWSKNLQKCLNGSKLVTLGIVQSLLYGFEKSIQSECLAREFLYEHLPRLKQMQNSLNIQDIIQTIRSFRNDASHNGLIVYKPEFENICKQFFGTPTINQWFFQDQSRSRIKDYLRILPKTELEMIYLTLIEELKREEKRYKEGLIPLHDLNSLKKTFENTKNKILTL